MKANRILLAVWGGIALTACSQNDEWQSEETASPVEVQFAGELTTATATRATATKEEWSDLYTTVGITPAEITGASATGNTIGQYYNVSYQAEANQDDATTATLTADEGAIYFQSPKETVTFAAYAPRVQDVAKEGDSKGLITLAPDETNNVEDYIWAKAEGITYTNHKASFEFQHVQSKLTIQLELDESVSSADVTLSKLGVAGLVTIGTFNIETGESLPTEGASATEFSTDLDGTSQTVQYIIIPQTVGGNALEFTVTTSNGDIYKKTFTTESTFQQGYAYNYKITAKKYELEVTEATILGWNEQDEVEEDAMMSDNVLKQFDVFDNPAEAQIYDIAFSDGTFMRIADENGLIPSNIIIPSGKSASGIVYYIGDVTKEDNALKSDYENCTHGLIFALDNNPSINCWMSSAVNVYSSFQVTSEYGNNSTYKAITETNYKIGYSNTIVLRAYNATAQTSSSTTTSTSSSGGALVLNPDISAGSLNAPSTVMQLVSKVDNFGTAPTNASSWYIPSIAELMPLAEEGLLSIINYMTKSLLNFETIGGYYWSSSEYDTDNAYSLIYDGSKNYTYQTIVSKNSTQYWLRPICAF